jgi:glycosyltransferase involved in cell wall biosynthesis
MKLAMTFGKNVTGQRALDLSDTFESNPRGMTGTDSAFTYQALHMAERGHDVTIYAVGQVAHEWRGIKVRPYPVRSVPEPFDAVIAMADPEALAFFRAPIRAEWCELNDFDFTSSEALDRVTDFIVISQALTDHLKRIYQGDKARWHVMGNGCNPADYEGVEKVPGRCIFTSSPDRGLDVLLQQWPRIRAAVPNAELRVFYHSLADFLSLTKTNFTSPVDQERKRRAGIVAELLPKLQGEGVSYVGGVSRERMAREYAEAEILAYPFDPVVPYTDGWGVEGYGTAVLEGCASGAVPVITNADAFEEVYGGHVPMFDHGEGWQEQWADCVIKLLTMPDEREGWAGRGREFSEKNTWPIRAEQLEGILQGAIRSELEKQFTPAVEIDGHRSIVFSLTPNAASSRVIDPRDPTGGAWGGGSRNGYMGLVRAFGRLGKYKVTALSTFKDKRLDLDGVEYVRIDRSHEVDAPDVHFGYYDVSCLIGSRAKLRIGSHHTCLPFHAWQWIDVHTAPCQWAVDFLKRGYRPHGEWHVLPNAVEGLEGVVRAPVPGRVVYQTSPDRGLHHLIGMWPAIRARVPGATLHVTGDVAEVCAWADNPNFLQSYESERGREFKAAIDAAHAVGGLTLLGRLPRAGILRELSEAACFAFPAEVSAPCETFSISVLECLTIGLPVVMAPVDAFESLWTGAVAMSPSPVREHLDEFVDAVVDVLTSEKLQRQMAIAGKARAALYSFDRSAAALDQIIEDWFARP